MAPRGALEGGGAEEVDTLACNRPQFCKTGTHRCPQGEELLDHLARRDDQQQEINRKAGRQWKTAPGPGAYRTPRTVGDGAAERDLNLDEVNIEQQPIWSIGKSRRKRTYSTIGGSQGSWQHEGQLQKPASMVNLSPGPGTYRTWSSFAPGTPKGTEKGRGLAPNYDMTQRSSDVVFNPNGARSTAWSFGGRWAEEVDTLAANRPQFSKTGTHRTPQGEELLDHLARRDDKQQEVNRKAGRQWKAGPGPGAYRTPRTVGDGAAERDLNLDEVNIEQQPIWSIGTARRKRTYATLGGSQGQWQHEGLLTHPKSDFNLTPGPGTHYRTMDVGLSQFA
eukprot:CAMPEP_0204324540 /NCGR_PEP_ID=MMETSP0469-20131031/10314_1 /ASSEMBLY_ACC=CAM_ASM_000384 /TAXON_ID=2969 /ORGANISM="Oxyrrhis marina" /LENGTH=334 /DNA_ID=CAMNT_0051306217 /DNA_START=72 /DNA_END=1075 /DNA_ORIENTATION=-